MARTTAAVQWYMVQDHGAAYGDPEHLYVRSGGLFEQRVDAAVEILHRRSVDSGSVLVTVPKVPDFLAVYGPDLDAFGHLEGAESPNTGPLLAELDRQLGRLVQATKVVDIYKRTAFILTPDHGMTSWERSFLEELAVTPELGRGVEIVLAQTYPDEDGLLVHAWQVGEVLRHGPRLLGEVHPRRERAASPVKFDARSGRAFTRRNCRMSRSRSGFAMSWPKRSPAVG